MNGTAFSCKDGMLVQDRVGVDRGTVRDGAGGKDVGTRPNACHHAPGESRHTGR